MHKYPKNEIIADVSSQIMESVIIPVSKNMHSYEDWVEFQDDIRYGILNACLDYLYDNAIREYESRYIINYPLDI